MRTPFLFSVQLSLIIVTATETLSNNADNVKNDHSPNSVWIETVAGFNPMILVAYDILVANETRMSLWDHGRVRSLQVVPLTINEDEDRSVNNKENRVPLIEKVITANAKPITRTLRDPNFGQYVERWMTILHDDEVDNLKALRKILARKEIGMTFKEMDTMSKKDKTQDVSPSDFKEMIVQSLDSLITVLSGNADAESREVVAAGYVGACARVLLLKLKEDDSEDFNLFDYLKKFVHDECKSLDIQKRVNRLMAVVNSGLLLEGILINKGILPPWESRVPRELHELYYNAEQKINGLLTKCAN